MPSDHSFSPIAKSTRSRSNLFSYGHHQQDQSHTFLIRSSTFFSYMIIINKIQISFSHLVIINNKIQIIAFLKMSKSTLSRSQLLSYYGHHQQDSHHSFSHMIKIRKIQIIDFFLWLLSTKSKSQLSTYGCHEQDPDHSFPHMVKIDKIHIIDFLVSSSSTRSRSKLFSYGHHQHDSVILFSHGHHQKYTRFETIRERLGLIFRGYGPNSLGIKGLNRGSYKHFSSFKTITCV